MAGRDYGKDGRSFLRMNVACPKAKLMDGLERLKNAILTLEKERR